MTIRILRRSVRRRTTVVTASPFSDSTATPGAVSVNTAYSGITHNADGSVRIDTSLVSGLTHNSDGSVRVTY